MPQVYNVGARSLFVNLVAWAMIVAGAACAALLAAHAGDLAHGLQRFTRGPLQPAALWLLEHRPWVLAALALAALLLITAAVGLLRRLEWARRAFVAVGLFGFLALVASFSVQHEVVALAVQQVVHGNELSAATLALIDQLTSAARALVYAVLGAACVVLLVLVRALLSEEVRREFA